MKKRGFTLIELLVVIAIIGIISSIVIISVRVARERAKDTRIKADMIQIRTAAEMYYSGPGNDSYLGFSCTVTEPNMAELCADINSQLSGNPTIVVKSDNTGYCAYKQLMSTKYFCVDSIGRAEEYVAVPTTCVAATASCQ